MISVYADECDNGVTEQRKRTFVPFDRLIRWGRTHPVEFVEKIFRIRLLDHQRAEFYGLWACKKGVLLCSRGSGKTFVLALYMAVRAILFPSQRINIVNTSAKQAQDSFNKLADIARKNIQTLTGVSDVLMNEVMKPNSANDGFKGDSKRMECHFYNGSQIVTSTGTEKTVVGERSTLLVFDEAGGIPDGMYNKIEPFAATNSQFKTGTKLDASVYPDDIPNQMIYIGSATSTDTHFYAVYKECALEMMMGHTDAFVMDVDCEVPLHPTMDGEPYPAQIEQKTIDDAMRDNPIKAQREYYNKFDYMGDSNSLLRRDDINRNSFDIVPALCQETFLPNADARKYVLCWDPALQADNSFILIANYWKDKGTNEWKARIVNGINLVETAPNGAKKPLRVREQIEWVRKLVVAYNGPQYPEYSNVDLMVDVGSGGGGREYSELLWDNWSESGKVHCGLIDKADENSLASAPKYPDAKNVCHMIEPRLYRSQMFEAMGSEIQSDHIMFPNSPSHDKTIDMGQRDKEGNEMYRPLSDDELRALIECDVLKEEVLMIVKTKTSAGNVQYGFPPDRARKYHDDRAYTCAMLSFWVSELNRKERSLQGGQRMDYARTLRGTLENGAPAPAGSQSGQPGAKPFGDGIPFLSGQNPFWRR